MNEQQTALADTLRDKGVPAEFAILIAQRVRKADTTALQSMDPEEVLWGGFTWRETDEGHTFWESMADAIREEQRA